MKLKIFSIMICLFYTISILTGCGTSQTATADSPGIAESEATVGEDNTSKTADNNDVKEKLDKSIVIVQEAIGLGYDEASGNIVKTLESGGYIEGKNANITKLMMDGDQKKAPEDILNVIKEQKPDVVLCIVGPTCVETVVKPISALGIPVILNGAVEEFIGPDGKPNGNITGIYSKPKDAEVNAFNLLEQLSPTNGKKAVFVTTEGFFKEEVVMNTLKSAGVDLKEYCESKFVEDFKASVEKYNKDEEVAWILIGVWPSTLKDGTTVNQMDVAKWDRENRKKPSITFWDSAVGLGGFLCAIGMDISETGVQVGNIAMRIFDGEKVGQINAEYPSKTNISLNKRNADDLKIEIPADMLGSAAKVYIDYEGHTN